MHKAPSLALRTQSHFHHMQICPLIRKSIPSCTESIFFEPKEEDILEIAG